jgi:hypothetical protein
MMLNDRYGENRNMRRVAGAWREQNYDGRRGVFLGWTDDRSMTPKQLGARLSNQEKRTLVAVHEVGHATANHALGLALGPVELLTDAPEALGDGILLRLGKATWAEREPRAAWETATTAMAGWAAGQLWLNEYGQLDEYTSLYIQFAVIGDHDWLLNIPTLRPTAYLYGTDRAPEQWNGQLLNMVEVVQQAMRILHSRWTDILKLSDELERNNALSPQAIMKVLEEPGWARLFRVRGMKSQ